MAGSIAVPASADADAISALAHRSFSATFAHLYSPHDLAEFLAGWNQPTQLAQQLADPDWAIRVWRDAEGIAGFIKMGPLDLPLPPRQCDEVAATELHQLYVESRAQGMGAAQALMGWALDWARAAGYARIYLSVFIDNHRAQAFYRRYGFAEVGCNPFRVGATIDDDRIWRLDL